MHPMFTTPMLAPYSRAFVRELEMRYLLFNDMRALERLRINASAFPNKRDYVVGQPTMPEKS